MSKRKKHKRPPRRKHHPKREHKTKPPLALIDAVASALNDCHQAGVCVWLDHDVAWSRHAVILPPFRNAGWSVRRLNGGRNDGRERP